MLKKSLRIWPLVLTLIVGICLTCAAGPPARPGADSGPVEISVVVRPGGAWEGEARFPSASVTLDAELERDLAAIFGPRGIDYGWQEPAVIALWGGDPRRIVEAALEAGCVSADLAGPLRLELRGFVRAGEVLSITLPANPSTGYTWAAEGELLSPIGEGEVRPTGEELGAPVRQVLRFTAEGTGQARLALSYRRPWEDAPPARVVSVRSTGLDLAGTCAALSLPLPPAAVPHREPALQVETPSSTQDLPTAYNWCDHGGCTSVKDQGQCGSCWAFATVGALESALKIRQGLTTDLSEQYLLSCNIDGWNCTAGGWWAHDYHWWKKPSGESQAGAVLESSFPYQASDIPCGGPYSHPYRISDWSHVGSGYGVPSVDAIKQAIYDHGPVAAAIYVGNDFQNYDGGLFQTDETGTVNHAILLVGWDEAEQAWILRNSWGPGWGESGYMRIRYGTSSVGSSANYVIYNVPFVATDQVYLPLVVRSPGTSPAGGLRNGDFESGRDGAWSEASSNGWDLILSGSNLPVSPHGGSWAAWLGGDSDETATLSQQVTIPSDATTLYYWVWSASEDSCGYDFAYVRFGSTTLRAYDLCQDQNTGGWSLQQIDVTGWRGQTVDLRFVVETDWVFNSNFFLDDVSISTAAAAPVLSAPSGPPGGSAAPATARKAVLLPR